MYHLKGPLKIRDSRKLFLPDNPIVIDLRSGSSGETLTIMVMVDFSREALENLFPVQTEPGKADAKDERISKDHQFETGIHSHPGRTATSAVLVTERVMNERIETLTPRQKEVVALIARGMTSKEIALDLAIAPDTVNNHTKQIYLRLGVRNRAEAVAVWDQYAVAANTKTGDENIMR